MTYKYVGFETRKYYNEWFKKKQKTLVVKEEKYFHISKKYWEQ